MAHLNDPIPFANESFDAVLSLDAVLHLRNIADPFRDAARVLPHGGRFMFTDAGVVTGAISDDDARRRAVPGCMQFVPPGVNERPLDQAGLRMIEYHDRTASVLANATGRLTARPGSKSKWQYLNAVITLSRRGAVLRLMYLAVPRTA